jgi:hypothetical protein
MKQRRNLSVKELEAKLKASAHKEFRKMQIAAFDLFGAELLTATELKRVERRLSRWWQQSTEWIAKSLERSKG